MIQAKCIQKFRRDNGQIYGYRLIDLNGQTQDVKPDNLKRAIRNNTIKVVNLTLTTDNRLVDTTEKQLQSKSLGEAPKQNLSKPKSNDNKSEYKELAKLMTDMDYSFIDMGDSYEDVVYNLVTSAGLTYDVWSLDKYYDDPNFVDLDYDDSKILKKISIEAYEIMLANKPKDIIQIVGYWVDPELQFIDLMEENIKYEHVDNVNKSTTLKTLVKVAKYMKEHKAPKELMSNLKSVIDKLKMKAVDAINVGYTVGHEYFRYLDSKIFGTITNSYYTVGHTITTNDEKYLKAYAYKCAQDFNILSPRPEVAIAFCFRNGEHGKVLVDVKLERKGYVGEHCVSAIGFVKDLETIELDVDNDENAKIVAERCNELGIQVKKFAEKHTSLLKMLPMGEPLERL